MEFVSSLVKREVSFELWFLLDPQYTNVVVVVVVVAPMLSDLIAARDSAGDLKLKVFGGNDVAVSEFLLLMKGAVQPAVLLCSGR